MAGRVFDEAALSIVRRAYARQILDGAGVADDPRLEEAFATVPREDFLAPGPWQIADGQGGYRTLTANDPVLLYRDVLVALAPGRGVNNGSPILHAQWLHAAALGQGSRVAHLGAGTGYYSAILSRLVGARGRVLAVEVDPTLAELARRNLSRFDNVTVVRGDGADWPAEPVDCIYVNFAVARPAEAWIEGLAPDGRLLFPIGVPVSPTPGAGFRRSRPGCGLLVTERPGGLAAKWLGPAFFVFTEGPLLGSAEEHEALAAAFERGGVEFVRSLQWHCIPDATHSWYLGPGWALSYDRPAGDPAAEPVRRGRAAG